jgi:D-3-phosphoglycerate dehydrogenase / 2-oxoglutarate reductase
VVCNAPQSNVVSAAEHTVALLLALARNIPQAHAALVEGRWERSRWNGTELHDKVLGVLGLGRIGTLVAQRATRSGCGWWPTTRSSRPTGPRGWGRAGRHRRRGPRGADFVTVHLPKTPETVGAARRRAAARR